MAPLRGGTLSKTTLSASLLLFFAAITPAITAAQPQQFPDASSLSTVYDSSQSAAGFMFDMRAKENSDIVVYGLDVNMVGTPTAGVNVLVYTKEGTFRNSENDEDAWDLWINATVVSNGMEASTPIPQMLPFTVMDDSDAAPPILIPVEGRRAFYIAFEGPYLRYGDVAKLYYQNHDAVIYGAGAAKRKGWRGTKLTPRTFNGALYYYKTDEGVVDLGSGVGLLPEGIVSDQPTESPSKSPSSSPIIPPTAAPSESNGPTVSFEPTDSPTTASPTDSPSPPPTMAPTPPPTKRPTSSPVATDLFMTQLEDSSVKPVLVYAGSMFDVKAREDIELATIAFNTYIKNAKLDMQLYIRYGGYEGAENRIKEWELRGNVTVVGRGMGNPTYLEEMSFEPILIRKGQTVGIYLTTSGPFMRASKGDVEGRPQAANAALVLYQGVGKRYPIDAGTISPRVFNGVLGYRTVHIPTTAPTMKLDDDLFVVEETFAPVADTYISKNEPEEVAGRQKAMLMVDGQPKKVALVEFDISTLNGNTRNEPLQILSATLRLYSMAQSEFGGYVSMIPGGEIDEWTTNWNNSAYGEGELGTDVGEFPSIWPDKYYDMDITHAFRDNGPLPRSFVMRIGSNHRNGVMYRSRDGGSKNGPRLILKFAYDPDVNKNLAKKFGSNPPTMAPTVKVTWQDAEAPDDPSRRYFNYDPRGRYGPDRWDRIEDDGYYDRIKGLKTSMRNKCEDGRRQSPRNLCGTNGKCEEFHEIRFRRGEYGLGLKNETVARPTALIMHNKLRLTYKQRRSEWERPEPHGADFALNGFNSGVQDIIHTDLKVRSEHRLCGKQYDAELQHYYLHRFGNLEAVAVLINGGGLEDNPHFEKLLAYFQKKFDGDKRLCQRRQRRARALFLDSRRNDDGSNEMDQEEEDATVGQSFSQLRGSSESTSDTLEEEEEVGPEATEAEDGASTSLSSYLYQRFLRLVQRRAAKWDKWDPMKPWDIQKGVHFWHYSGSVTEPPCFEDVNWRVMDVPMEISNKQLTTLKRLMFDHVDPNNCRKTSTHYDESNARPTKRVRSGSGPVYRCRRSDYASDMERAASGRVKGFVMEKKWWGVKNYPYVEPEFPNVA